MLLMGNFVNEFLEQVSRIQDVSERLMKFDDFITRLEDEFTKIYAFKRQLPLCILLLNHAIMAVKEERMQCRKLNGELVLEEFIPLTRTCDQDDDGTKESTDTKEKMNWLRTSDLHQPIQDDEPHPGVLNDPINCRLSQSVGIGFLPFKGYSGLPFSEARKEEEDSPRLSLRTPGMENITDDIHVSGMSSKTSAGRACSSSFSIARSSVGGGVSQLQQQGTRKQRRCWSPDLHRRFLEALQQLGGSQVATPKQIRELMQVDGLTNDEVKSHLQKYRLHARRAPAVPGTIPNQPVCSGDLWSSHDQLGETLKLSKSNSYSPPGPLHFGGTSQGTSTTGCDDIHDEGEENSLKYHAHSSETSNV